MSETVSVIVPVFNAERYLEMCVDSLRGQSYRALEIILVDDGSTDDSLEVCRRLAQMDQRIRVLHHANQGPSVTRNAGISVANGKYLMFVDADDWLEMDAIEAMVSAMEQTRADLVLGGYARFNDGSTRDCSLHFITQEPLQTLEGPEGIALLFTQARTSLAGVSVWAKLYRTELVRAHHVSFPETISYEEDCYFNLQYYRHIAQAAVIGRCVYHYRQTPLSLSKKYRPQSFAFLLNGYRERCRFFQEIGLSDRLAELDQIMLIVLLSTCKKISLSDLSVMEKRAAYDAVIDAAEIQQIVRNVQVSEGKLMKTVVWAVRLHCTEAVMLLMALWRWKHGMRPTKEEGENQ